MSLERDKFQDILKAIKKDPFGVDLSLSFLIAASSSYRHDTVLKPFPPQCISEDGHVKHYEKLDNILNKIPTVADFDSKKDDEVVELLHWCVKHGKFVLRSCPSKKLALITELTGDTGGVPSPTHIFEVKYCQSSEEKFQERRCGRDLLYAYHGSRLENFHCILHQGLQGHVNKNSLFGEGTYLSAELSVSMAYAPAGLGWKESRLGEKMSCIAVCEIIDDHERVRCQQKQAKPGDSGVSPATSPNRSRIANSVGGDIPEKYYVVQNNDLLRVKYLLIYAEKAKLKNFRQSRLFQHKFLLTIVFYTVILLVVGLCNSRFGQKIANYIKS